MKLALWEEREKRKRKEKREGEKRKDKGIILPLEQNLHWLEPPRKKYEKGL